MGGRKAVKPMTRVVTTALGGLFVLWLMLNLFIGGSLLHFRFWAPQIRDAQREVFEQSQSFVQGKISHLTRLQLEYEAADGNRKEALRRMILTEAATVDADDLPESLQSFVAELRGAE